MIKPTVGRVVHFHPHQAEPFAFSDQPLAALVTYVHSDTMVNVVVFDSNGNPHPKTSIRLQQDEPLDAKGGNFVAWMPYQVGQAAKTEKAEADLAASIKPRDVAAEKLDASGSYSGTGSAY